MDFVKKGYKLWQPPVEWPYIKNNLWQKRIENDVVCEENDKLYINVKEYAFEPYGETPLQTQYTVEIVLELGNKWWTLNCYSLNEDSITDLDQIEQILISLVNHLDYLLKIKDERN